MYVVLPPSLVWRKEMGDTIGQILPSAVGVAISPFPIIAVVLMLVTARGRVNGPAFVLGWVAGLALVGAVLLTAASGVDPRGQGEPATWVSVVVLVLGVLLLFVALKQWRGRPRQGDEVKMPKWMEALDKFSPVKATGAGVILSALNPKNLLLAVAAAAIAQTGISTDQQVVAYVIFVLLATIGVGAPVLIYFVMGDRSRALLDRLKNWLARNNAVIMAVLLLIIGVKLIGDGVSGLWS
jgi:threonine/homoserine/homoserine lactone efflux protein